MRILRQQLNTFSVLFEYDKIVLATSPEIRRSKVTLSKVPIAILKVQYHKNRTGSYMRVKKEQIAILSSAYLKNKKATLPLWRKR